MIVLFLSFLGISCKEKVDIVKKIASIIAIIEEDTNAYVINDGEDFCIKVKDLDQNKRERFRTIYLTRECWDSIYVGMLFCISGNRDTYDFTWNNVPENPNFAIFH